LRPLIAAAAATLSAVFALSLVRCSVAADDVHGWRDWPRRLVRWTDRGQDASLRRDRSPSVRHWSTAETDTRPRGASQWFQRSPNTDVYTYHTLFCS